VLESRYLLEPRVCFFWYALNVFGVPCERLLRDKISLVSADVSFISNRAGVRCSGSTSAFSFGVWVVGSHTFAKPD